MTTLTEAVHAAAFIVSESDDGHLSRDQVTIDSGVTVNVGTVLGQKTVGGRFVPLNPAATDGSQNASAIAIYPAVVGAGATARIAVIARVAEVRAADLDWGAATAAQIAAATAQLAALNIILR